MRATTIHAPGDIRFEEVADPTIEEPTDAIVKVVAGCICGSDLWPYRGHNDIDAGATIGHECVGVVEEVGADV
ncbi:MAG: alcohol dehydrogenase catalytic domain-containing protein, partial [Nocardioides sp.]